MSNEQLRERLASAGKTLTERERGRIASAQEAAARIALDQHAATQPETEENRVGPLERFLHAVPSLVGFIADVGDTLTTITQAIIPASLPFLLVLLIFAEAERVRHGVMLFEDYEYLGYIVAYILVIGNAFIELAIKHRHRTHDYHDDAGFQFSFRILAKRLGYIFGMDEDRDNDVLWQPRRRSPALKLERLQRWLTLAILALAVGGSMRSQIIDAPGNWRTGALSLATDSSLAEFMTIISGLIAAVVIVLLAQAIVAYSYDRAADYYHELLDRKAAAGSNPAQEAWQQQREQVASVAREQVEREMLLKLLAKVDPNESGPSGSTPTTPGGQESTPPMQRANGPTVNGLNGNHS